MVVRRVPGTRIYQTLQRWLSTRVRAPEFVSTRVSTRYRASHHHHPRNGLGNITYLDGAGACTGSVTISTGITWSRSYVARWRLGFHSYYFLSPVAYTWLARYVRFHFCLYPVFIHFHLMSIQGAFIVLLGMSSIQILSLTKDLIYAVSAPSRLSYATCGPLRYRSWKRIAYDRDCIGNICVSSIQLFQFVRGSLRFLFLFEYRWSCLGIRLAHVARENVDFNAETAVILTGRYVETAVSDSSVLLYSTPVTIWHWSTSQP